LGSGYMNRLKNYISSFGGNNIGNVTWEK
jgi:hypothetical protein